MDSAETTAANDLTSQGSSGACVTFEFVISCVVLVIICVLGVVGNVISFCVFQREQSTKNSTSLLFQALAVTDCVLLVLSVPQYSTGPLVDYVQSQYLNMWSLRYYAYIQVYIHPLCLTAQTVTIWTTVLAGFNRYVAVCHPAQVINGKLSPARIKLCILLVVVVATLYINLPWFFANKIQYECCIYNDAANSSQYIPLSAHTRLGNNYTFQLLYHNLSYFILLHALPLITLLILDIKLIRTLQNLRRKRLTMQSRQQQHDNNATRVLIVVVMVFIVSQTPALVNHLLWTILPDTHRECGNFHYFWRIISNLLVIINSSCNFIIYITFNTKFRQSLFGGPIETSQANNIELVGRRSATAVNQELVKLTPSSRQKSTSGKPLDDNV